MEEKNSQELEINTEAAESNTQELRAPNAELVAAEGAQSATANEPSPTEEDTKEESIPQEEVAEEEAKEEPAEEGTPEEETAEEESVAEEPQDEVTDENAAEEPIAEDVDAASPDEAVQEAEATPEEEPEKESEKESAAPEVSVAGNGESSAALVKAAAVGLVVKPWQLAVAAVVVAAMVVGGVVLGVVLGNRNNPNDSDFDDSPVDYEWVLPEGGHTNEDQIILPGYVDLTFPAGEDEIEVVLPNPAGNPCYFRYTLMIEETGEILYQSKLIPPGKAVLEIKLSRPLTKGDYSLLIAIDSISLTDGRTPMNGGEQKVFLKVR